MADIVPYKKPSHPLNDKMDELGINMFDIALRKTHPQVEYRKSDDSGNFDMKRMEFMLKEEKDKVKYLLLLLEVERANNKKETP